MNYRKFFWIGVFVLGLIVGTLYVNFFIDRSMVYDVGEVLFLANDYDANLVERPDMIYIGIKRIILFTFLTGSALLCRNNLVLCMSTVFFGGCFGVVNSMIALTFQTMGIQRLFWYLVPHYIFYITAFCVILQLADYTVSGHKKYRQIFKTVSGGKMIVKLILLVLAGIMSECFINQWIIQYFNKIF